MSSQPYHTVISDEEFVNRLGVRSGRHTASRCIRRARCARGRDLAESDSLPRVTLS